MFYSLILCVFNNQRAINGAIAPFLSVLNDIVLFKKFFKDLLRKPYHV